MNRFAYLASSTAFFIVLAAMHVASYRFSEPGSLLATSTAAAVVLCVPVVVLFFRTRKMGTADLWPRFWQSALVRCPRWIGMIMSGTVILMWITGALTAFSRLPQATFQTSALLIPSSVALCYSVSLWRSNENGA
jgi:hypothetical protein